MFYELSQPEQIIGLVVAIVKQSRKRQIVHFMWIFPCFEFSQIGGFDPSHTSIMSVSSINQIVLIMARHGLMRTWLKMTLSTQVPCMRLNRQKFIAETE